MSNFFSNLFFSKQIIQKLSLIIFYVFHIAIIISITLKNNCRKEGHISYTFMNICVYLYIFIHIHA